MSSFSPKITSSYSADFLRKIDVSNSTKQAAPVALFLISKDVLKTPEMSVPFSSFIQTVSSCNYVAIELIETIKQIKEIINNKKKLLGKSIDLLVINAHGSDTRIYLSDEAFYEIKEVEKDQYDGLSKDANILLHCCMTGSSRYNMKSIAQTIADVSRRIVLAPTRPISAFRVWCYFCEKHNRIEFQTLDLEHNPYVFEFQSKKKPQLLSCRKDQLMDYFKNYEYSLGLEASDSSCLMQAEYLIKNEDDQLLETYYKDGLKSLKLITEFTQVPSLEYKVGKKLLEHEEYELAYRYIYASARQNNVDAILLVGDKCYSEEKLLEAKEMYQKAESLGFSSAKEKLAIVEEAIKNQDRCALSRC
jgi:hypothetical protein